MQSRAEDLFAAAVLPTEDRAGKERWVIVLKAAFRIVPGAPAVLEPGAVIERADRFADEPFLSSLLAEDDLAPFKPRADVLVHAVAIPPGAEAAARWPVRLEVGELCKELTVTGPRSWIRARAGYGLEEPPPCTAVPIRYELGYGGSCEGEQGELELFEQNPAGLGYVRQGQRPSFERVRAPQIEDPRDPIGPIDRTYAPAGLGPVARTWMPRRARIGTTDERWRTERAPRLPLDFDESFYNCAHPDLVAPGYLRGDERVIMVGLGPEPLSFALPGIRPTIRLLPKQQAPRLALDTLVIDVPAQALSLVWRGKLPAGAELTELVIEKGAAIDGH